MQSTNLTGFVLKKEACRVYNRSFRQLGRDFDKANAKGDAEFASNFRLRIEDGTVMEASEVDKDKVQALRDKGLNPTWFVRESWMQDTYGVRRDGSETESPTTATEPQPTDSTKTQEAHGLSDSIAANPDIVQAKDDLIEVLREETKYLRDMLSKERERSSDDKQLTRELHVLLKNMQDRLLPAPSSEQHTLPSSDTPVSRHTTTDIERVPIRESVQATVQPKGSANAALSKRSTKKRTTRKPNETAKKKVAAKPKKSPSKKTVPKKPKWYEMPTIQRFFSSSK